MTELRDRPESRDSGFYPGVTGAISQIRQRACPNRIHEDCPHTPETYTRPDGKSDPCNCE